MNNLLYSELIDDKFEGLDELSAEKLQLFFERYGAMVRANCAHATLAHVRGAIGIELEGVLSSGAPLHEAALGWLLGQPEETALSTVLVGMHQPNYVEVAARVARNIQ